jgi:hypothetical protein
MDQMAAASEAQAQEILRLQAAQSQEAARVISARQLTVQDRGHGGVDHSSPVLTHDQGAAGKLLEGSADRSMDGHKDQEGHRDGENSLREVCGGWRMYVRI